MRQALTKPLQGWHAVPRQRDCDNYLLLDAGGSTCGGRCRSRNNPAHRIMPTTIARITS
jgi:hypothetical protein